MSTMPKKLIMAFGFIEALQGKEKSPEFLKPANNAKCPPALAPATTISFFEKPLNSITSSIFL